MGLLKELDKKEKELDSSKKKGYMMEMIKEVSSELSKGGNCDENTHVKTGVPGLDNTIYQGIPKGHLVLISGCTGTGKTVLGLQIANYHASQGKKVLFMSFEETKKQLISHMKNFGWNPEKLIKKGNLNIQQQSAYDVARKIDALMAKEKKELKSDIKTTIIPENFEPDIVVIDSLSALAAAFETQTKGTYRLYIDKIYSFLKEKYCTSFLISEKTGGSEIFSPMGVDEFIFDSVISLIYNPGEQQTVRSLEVIKIRGTDYRSGKINFEITGEGIVVYPKIPVDRNVGKTEFKNRKGSGIKELDKMLNGGYPEGHMIMISGNTGSGKTTFGMQFLIEGIKRGEKAIYINLEESTSQIIKTAKEHGWDLEKYKKQGKLKFVTPNLIDIYPDRVLYQILHEVQKSDSKRVVIDTLSSMISANINKNQLREFLLQLTGYFKTKGIICVMTYLIEEMFGGTNVQVLGSGVSSELRLSSIVDGIIILRYLETERSVDKVVNVLKLRGSGHDKAIRKFDLDKGGVKIDLGKQISDTSKGIISNNKKFNKDVKKKP